MQVLLSSISQPQKRVRSVCEGREKCKEYLSVGGASDVVVCHEGWSSNRLQSLLGAAFAEHTLSYD